MITVKVIVAVAIAAAVLSTAFAVGSQSFVDFLATAQDTEIRKNTIGGHIRQAMAYMRPLETF
jgi:hypothetical protein